MAMLTTRLDAVVWLLRFCKHGIRYIQLVGFYWKSVLERKSEMHALPFEDKMHVFPVRCIIQKQTQVRCSVTRATIDAPSPDTEGKGLVTELK